MVENRLLSYLPHNLVIETKTDGGFWWGQDQGKCGMVKILVEYSELGWFYWKSAMCRISEVGAERKLCNYRGHTPYVTVDARGGLWASGRVTLCIQ